MGASMFNRIVYATDMTDSSIVASHYALRLSNECNAHLSIISVIPDEVEEMSANMSYDLAAHYDKDVLDAYTSDEVDNSRAMLIKRINALCTKLKRQLHDCKVRPNVSIRSGDPAEQILLEAEKEDADLIVVGTGRHNLLDRFLCGSVAKEVVQKSPVPVITIPLAQ
jgi:nucleotide-binding universal stress UspA family protein